MASLRFFLVVSLIVSVCALPVPNDTDDGIQLANNGFQPIKIDPPGDDAGVIDTGKFTFYMLAIDWLL